MQTRRSYRSWVLAAVGAVGIATPVWGQNPGRPAPARTAMPAQASREVCTSIQLAWLADPGTFGLTLTARPGPQGIELVGFAPTEPLKQRALQIAQTNAAGQRLLDGVKIHGGMALRTAAPGDTTETELAAMNLLANQFGERAVGCVVRASDDGKLLLQVTGLTAEEQVQAAKLLRKVPQCNAVVCQHGSMPGMATVKPSGVMPASYAPLPEGPAMPVETTPSLTSSIARTATGSPPSATPTPPSPPTPPASGPILVAAPNAPITTKAIVHGVVATPVPKMPGQPVPAPTNTPTPAVAAVALPKLTEPPKLPDPPKVANEMPKPDYSGLRTVSVGGAMPPAAPTPVPTTMPQLVAAPPKPAPPPVPVAKAPPMPAMSAPGPVLPPPTLAAAGPALPPPAVVALPDAHADDVPPKVKDWPGNGVAPSVADIAKTASTPAAGQIAIVPPPMMSMVRNTSHTPEPIKLPTRTEPTSSPVVVEPIRKPVDVPVMAKLPEPAKSMPAPAMVKLPDLPKPMSVPAMAKLPDPPKPVQTVSGSSMDSPFPTRSSNTPAPAPLSKLPDAVNDLPKLPTITNGPVVPNPAIILPSITNGRGDTPAAAKLPPLPSESPRLPSDMPRLPTISNGPLPVAKSAEPTKLPDASMPASVPTLPPAGNLPETVKMPIISNGPLPVAKVAEPIKLPDAPKPTFAPTLPAPVFKLPEPMKVPEPTTTLPAPAPKTFLPPPAAPAELPKASWSMKPVEAPKAETPTPVAAPALAKQPQPTTPSANLPAPAPITAAKIEVAPKPVPALAMASVSKPDFAPPPMAAAPPVARAEPVRPTTERYTPPAPKPIVVPTIAKQPTVAPGVQQASASVPTESRTVMGIIRHETDPSREPANVETVRSAVVNACQSRATTVTVQALPNKQLRLTATVATTADWEALVTKIKALPETNHYSVIYNTTVTDGSSKPLPRAEPAIYTASAASAEPAPIRTVGLARADAPGSPGKQHVGVIRQQPTGEMSPDDTKKELERICQLSGVAPQVQTLPNKQLKLTATVRSSADWERVVGSIKSLAAQSGQSIIFAVNVTG